MYQRAQEIQEANRKLQTLNDELTKSEFSKSKLAAIVEFTDDAIIGISLEGTINSWNIGAEHLYGYTVDEIVGQSLSILCGTKDLKLYEDMFNNIKMGQPMHYSSIERRHADGHFIPILATISPVRNKENQVIGACGIERDITEWKRIEKIKNEFISVVSHELRTSLTSIRGSLGIVSSGAAGTFSEKNKQLIEIANKNSERLLLLINDILDVEKIEAEKMHFNMQIININQFVREAMDVNKIYAEKFSINLRLDERVIDISVSADPARLMQVIVNLLSNAVNFSPKHPAITIKITQQKDKVRVSVIDQGKGIPKEFHSHIFQPFSQADSSTSRGKSGTGLGLYISKAIMEKMGGSLQFKSAANKGTTFYFELDIKNSLCENEKNELVSN